VLILDKIDFQSRNVIRDREVPIKKPMANAVVNDERPNKRRMRVLSTFLQHRAGIHGGTIRQ
jgi:hypothetical protein